MTELKYEDRRKPMRLIEDHKVNPANDRLNIVVVDQPGAGGANHLYVIQGANKRLNSSYMECPASVEDMVVMFQNGPISEKGVGVNGITHEALLAIIVDRLRSFQSGPYACRENALALTKIEEALMWLQKRTLDRMRRNVEGTHQI